MGRQSNQVYPAANHNSHCIMLKERIYNADRLQWRLKHFALHYSNLMTLRRWAKYQEC